MIPQNTGLLSTYTAKPFIDIGIRENFMKRLNEKPGRIEKQNNADSIPISFLENELDEVYMGLWETKDFAYQVVANEIVGKITLRVYDPTVQTWIERVGAGAVQIRMNKDASITDIGQKIKTALQMDFPKLRTMCLKNAAKTLGKRFGRDLNRKFEDEYETVYTNEQEFNEMFEPLSNGLREAANVADLTRIWIDNPEFHNNPLIKKLFTSRKMALNLTK